MVMAWQVYEVNWDKSGEVDEMNLNVDSKERGGNVHIALLKKSLGPR